MVENGTYGQRIADICRMSRLDIRQVPMNLDKLQSTLASVKNIAGVIAVHCETGTGLMNPIETIGKIVKGKNDGKLLVLYYDLPRKRFHPQVFYV